MEIPPVEVKVSYPVIPLVECPGEMAEQVRESMASIVPCLQALTRLRYFPVMTCLVDRHLLHDILPDRKRNHGPHANQLKKEIQEITQFMESVTLTVHCRDYCYSRGHYIEGLDRYYQGFSPLSAATRQAVTDYCEYLPYCVIRSILDGSEIDDYDRIRIYQEELSSQSGRYSTISEVIRRSSTSSGSMHYRAIYLSGLMPERSW
ncbi:MAG: hypothetical protein AB2L14_09675 [Candidatus Xenobiia bacterium LiM19]